MANEKRTGAQWLTQHKGYSVEDPRGWANGENGFNNESITHAEFVNRMKRSVVVHNVEAEPRKVFTMYQFNKGDIALLIDTTANHIFKKVMPNVDLSVSVIMNSQGRYLSVNPQTGNYEIQTQTGLHIVSLSAFYTNLA